MNRFISSKEIKLVIFKVPIKENPNPVGFIDEFYQKNKKERKPKTNFSWTLPKSIRDRILFISFSEASVTLIPNPKTSQSLKES